MPRHDAAVTKSKLRCLLAPRGYHKPVDASLTVEASGHIRPLFLSIQRNLLLRGPHQSIAGPNLSRKDRSIALPPELRRPRLGGNHRDSWIVLDCLLPTAWGYGDVIQLLDTPGARYGNRSVHL
jgi:hypothetical protein